MRNAVAHDVSRNVIPAFEEAQRVTVVDVQGQPVTFVVLAVLTAVGNDFALCVREEDLGDPAAVVAFEYHADVDGEPSLAPIETEDLYEDVLHLFADLVGGLDED